MIIGLLCVLILVELHSIRLLMKEINTSVNS